MAPDHRSRLRLPRRRRPLAPVRSPRGLARGTLALAALVGLLHTGTPAGAAPTQGDPTVAPVTTLSTDGRTATDGVRTLTVSQAAGLSPDGQAVSVAGRGYDTSKGIYLALCVIPPANHPPSPCGGGVDTTGEAGAAHWISSNPPPYATGLPEPYGPGGTFSVNLPVRAALGSGIDCRTVRCAIVTRNDHTRASDRSQDILLPVTFATQAGPVATTPPSTGPTGPATAPALVPPTAAPPVVTLPPPTTTTLPPAPESTVSRDGRTATAGGRTLRASAVEGLDPERARVHVRGEGFDADRGIYVGLCAVPAGDGGPGPCLTGDDGASAWISSDPPDYGRDLARPYEPGGAFAVTLTIRARIDDATDCREVRCALVARRDDTAAADRSLDVVLPVTFADESATTPTTATTAPTTVATAGPDPAAPASRTSGGGGGSAWPWLAGGGVLAAGAAGSVALGVRRRRALGVVT